MCVQEWGDVRTMLSLSPRPPLPPLPPPNLQFVLVLSVSFFLCFGKFLFLLVACF